MHDIITCALATGTQPHQHLGRPFPFPSLVASSLKRRKCGPNPVFCSTVMCLGLGIDGDVAVHLLFWMSEPK